MDDDFNTAGALAQLFDLVRAINQARDAGAAMEALSPAQALLIKLAGVLGLTLRESSRSSSADPFVELLISIRSDLRAQKLWTLSDQIRDGLRDLGVVLEDSKDDSTWRWE
jgi:cysteinyl-tRNA synthetase